MKTVYLISCVSKQAPHPQPARSLFLSEWFKKAVRWVHQNLKSGDRWFILSARYQLVEPDTVLAPYGETMPLLSSAVRKIWADNVYAALRPMLNPGDRVVFLAGQYYRRDLVDRLRASGIDVDTPMEGLGIGQQLTWLVQHTINAA